MTRVQRDNIHSRLVTVLKVALPLLALALLSTLFLFSRRINPEDAIPYASVDVADRLREPRMTDATYSGMTGDGTTVTFSAAEARPETDGNARLSGVTGTLQSADGAKTQLAALAIQIDQAGGVVVLSKEVEVTTSTGYVVQMPELTVALNRTSAHSDGPVTAQAPLGQLEAGAMEITRIDGDSGAYLLVFNKRVHLLYLPQK